jgi:gamma-butyrobetaine dioxygenase
MLQATQDDAAAAVHVVWPDGLEADFPYLWLRDNCPSGLHPTTQERTFDLLSVPEDIEPTALRADAEGIEIDWARAAENAEPHHSRFPSAWLRAHCPGRSHPDPARVEPVLWRAQLSGEPLPRSSAAALLEQPEALAAWLGAVKRIGIGMVDDLADDADAGIEIARRIGFLRETNFGVTFEVISKPDPNNLAYTSDALPLHTDLPNQELPPGFQFLHCIRNAAQGGGSMFADGFAIAEDLRRDHPDAFALLSEVAIPQRFHDEDDDIRMREPVICLTREGGYDQIRFNAHIAAPFDMPAALQAAYYRAYRRYMAMTRDPSYQLTLRLAAGEMVVFDNRRILHGREAFDPATGERHLRGCYVDRGEWDSRMRRLARS